jgi:hypothetical protein
MRAFADTGYVVMRRLEGDHLVFDAGPHGYLNGGHAHADALAVTLTVRTQPLLIDPGTGTYTMDQELRNRMRASGSHNTVSLDGQSSAIPSGPFRWAARTDARLAALRTNPQFAWAEAFHDAYEPVRCTRSVLAFHDGWLIVDHVAGQGRHAVRGHWHIDPSWRVTCDGHHRLRAAHPDGIDAWIVWDHGPVGLACGDAANGLGWYSPRYGLVSPAWTARVTREGMLPASLATWIGEARDHAPPTIEHVRHDSDLEAMAIVTRLRQSSSETVTILRPGDRPVRPERRCDTAEYHTDARLLQYSVDARSGVRLSIADAACALSVGDRLVSIESGCPVSDLHLAAASGRLELWSCQPPARVRVHGEAIAGITSVTLNGRQLRHVRADGRTLILSSSDWGTDPDGSRPAGPRSPQERVRRVAQG